MNRSAKMTCSFAAGRSPRHGQVWSTDLMLSLFIFTIAAVVAYTIISNIVVDDEFEVVRAQAATAAELLVHDGYPQHWTAGDVLKVGITADGRLSLRKAHELGLLQYSDVRRRLRVNDDVYIYFTDAANNTVPVFGRCGVGGITVPTASNTTILPAAAIVGASHHLSDLVAANVTLPMAGYEALASGIAEREVVIVESSTLLPATAGDAAVRFARASLRGMTFVVVGDPGAGILGIVVNSTPTTRLTVQGTAGQGVGFALDEPLTVSGTIPTIETPGAAPAVDAAVSDLSVIALSSTGKIAYASWLYNDARVWYFATLDGLNTDGTPLADIIANATISMVRPQWPSCGAVDVPANARQVAIYDRVLPYHDRLLTAHVIVWRGA